MWESRSGGDAERKDVCYASRPIEKVKEKGSFATQADLYITKCSLSFLTKASVHQEQELFFIQNKNLYFN